MVEHQTSERIRTNVTDEPSSHTNHKITIPAVCTGPVSAARSQERSAAAASPWSAAAAAAQERLRLTTQEQQSQVHQAIARACARCQLQRRHRLRHAAGRCCEVRPAHQSANGMWNPVAPQQPCALCCRLPCCRLSHHCLLRCCPSQAAALDDGRRGQHEMRRAPGAATAARPAAAAWPPAASRAHTHQTAACSCRRSDAAGPRVAGCAAAKPAEGGRHEPTHRSRGRRRSPAGSPAPPQAWRRPRRRQSAAAAAARRPLGCVPRSPPQNFPLTLVRRSPPGTCRPQWHFQLCLPLWCI